MRAWRSASEIVDSGVTLALIGPKCSISAEFTIVSSAARRLARHAQCLPAVKTLDLVYFNAGGGHRAAATALEAVIRQQGRPWEVRLVNLMSLLDPKDVFKKTTGMD